MRSFVRLYSVVYPVVIFLPVSAFAQLQIVAGCPEVQVELGLNDEQRSSLSEISKRYDRIEGMTVLELSHGIPFDSLSTQQQEELRPRFAQKMVEVDAQALVELGKVLSAEQIERLKQIRIQALGPGGILSGKLNKDLNISSEELTALRNTATAFAKQFTDTRLHELANLNTGEINRVYQSALTDRLLESMTQEQRDKYLELAGNPIVLPRIADVR